MVLSEFVLYKINPSTSGFLRENKYLIGTHRFHPKHNPAKYGIYVKVEHLHGKSEAVVECKCDKCGVLYKNRLSRRLDYCRSCAQSVELTNYHKESSKVIDFGGKRFCPSGDNHPRWNPNKSEFKKYASLVMSITRKQDLSLLENFDKPRGLCGVPGAYQLDHIVSIKTGFDNNIPASVIGSLENLQFIPWEDNRKKWHN